MAQNQTYIPLCMEKYVPETAFLLFYGTCLDDFVDAFRFSVVYFVTGSDKRSS